MSRHTGAIPTVVLTLAAAWAAGVLLALSLGWPASAQPAPQPPAATVNQVIPITASVPVTLDDGSTQTVTVPLTVTLAIAVGVDGAASITADAAAEQPAANAPADTEPVAAEVTLDNAADFLPALADMPAGFKVNSEGEGSTNEELSESFPDPAYALEQFNSMGRLGSYYRDFAATGFNIVGNGTLEFSMVLFDNPQGAADAIALYRQRDQASVEVGDFDSIQYLSMPAIGETSEATVRQKAVTEQGAMDGYDFTQIAFQKGNALVFVAARSWPNTGDFKQLIDFAKWIASRLP